MIYYLDTNALYSIRRIQKDKISSCYTSIMAIMELVSGIDERNFGKRKAILSMVKSFKLTIDYAFPEEIIANSFDIFDEYEFIEQRDKPLLALVDAVIAADNFNAYHLGSVYNAEFGHEYFKHLDQNLSKNFTDASVRGIKQIKQFQREPSLENIIWINDVKFDLNTEEGLKMAFPLFSKSATLEAMCHLLVKLCRAPVTIEEVFHSYNHLTDIYLEVFSRYSEDQALNAKYPSKNDAQDLMHLLYLKNDYKKYMVSDDKIFEEYFTENSLNTRAISANFP